MQSAAKILLEDASQSPQCSTRPDPAEEQASGVIQRLKDDFGDYSDPLTYDWTWRETD